MNIKKRLLRTILLCLVGLGIGGAIAYIQISKEPVRVLKTINNENAPHGAMAGVEIGGPFSLTDHTGKNVTEADYADKFKLIYFGFTYCPAICPTELQKMAKVYEGLDAQEQKKFQQLFITVDPDRDTVDVMREYVALFDQNLVGLRGTAEQTKDIMSRYRIFATKVQDDEMTDYTVDHSTFLYLMSPDNQLLSIYRMRDEVDFILNDVRKFMGQS